ncbi:MAG TPA: nucleoside transporter C-terminal domain-containing protein [Myxococcota bacterium]|nr:nucleoside transporter C-terminal domain-containing protein [Myxococcota bacterium]
MSHLSLALLEPALAANFIERETTLMDRGLSLLGIVVMIAIAWALSEARRDVKWRPVAWGVALQLLFGFIVLMPALQDFFFVVVDNGVHKLLSFSEAGAEFVFQSIEPHQILQDGQEVTFRGRISPPVKTFAFWILPTIVFFSALMSVLYHLGIMQPLVKGIAWLMQRTMGTSGAESLAAASNVFVGQTEAPLVVRPYVDSMTRSELHALMCGGFATVAGGVMAAYVGFLDSIPGIAGHLVTASIMSAPAALAVSKVMVPELHVPRTMGSVPMLPRTQGNVLEACANGAADGMKLALNVAAMLIAFVGMVAMVDWVLSWIIVGGDPLSMSRMLGWLFTPIALAMGVPWEEAPIVGMLLGEKIVLTEFIAYIHLGEIVNSEVPMLSERSAIIASYGLCGFANFASIGIQLGGIGGIAPARMKDLASLALRAMIAGSLAAFMTGTVAGVILG